ncbi:MAG: hypothetical protein ACJ786_22955, partial [Catenulispora sp.]
MDQPGDPPARAGRPGPDIDPGTPPDLPGRRSASDQPADPDSPAHPQRRTGGWWGGPVAGTVTVAELATLGGAALVGLLGTVALATAHLGVFGPVQVLVPTAVLAVALAALARSRAAAPPRVALDPAGLLPVAAGGALALVLFLPGFHYAAGGADPGVYVMHAIAIARGHSTWIHDPLLAAGDLPVQVAGPGARFPGIWISDAATGTILPQFYHLWPALMATSYDAGGYRALVATTPLLGVLGVLLTAVLARRIAGPAGS